MNDSCQVFLSYGSPDVEIVEEIAISLRQAGILPWLDKWEIAAGDSFMEKIAAGLQSVPAIAVFISSASSRPWQHAEVEQAIKLRIDSNRTKRVIPVLIKGADVKAIPPFLDLNSAVSFPAASDPEALRLLICAIEGRPPGPSPDRIPVTGSRPYRGLKAFDVDDAGLFTGRDKLVQQILTSIEALLESPAPKLLGILGDSGSGKSSLARAGLIPKLLNRSLPQAPEWTYLTVKPGSSPLNALALALAGKDQQVLLELRRNLASDQTSLSLFATGLAGERGRLVLLVDQFEEVFSLCSDSAERSQFIALLMDACSRPDTRLLIAITLRADFYGACAAFLPFGSTLNHQHTLVGPMTAAELEQVITEPAVRTGYEVDPGLVEVLVKDSLDQPGSLPMLQFTLDELWMLRRGRKLTLEAYHSLDGLSGALNKRADAVYEKLQPEEQVILRRILLRLVQITADGRLLRTRVPLTSLLPDSGQSAQVVQQVLATLAGPDNRLVTITAEIDESGAKPAFVEVTHEALIRNWKKLRQWLEEQQNRSFVMWRQRFQVLLSSWREQKRPDDVLRGSMLHEAARLLKQRPDDFSREEAEFINASLAGASSEQSGARQRKILMWALSSAIVAALLALAFVAWRQPTVDPRIENARALLMHGASNLSLVIALRANLDRHTRETEALLQETFFGATEAPIESGGPISDIRFSNDGGTIVTASIDGSACVWQASSGTRVFCTEPRSSPALTAAIVSSPEGKARLMVLSGTGEIAQWSLPDWQPLPASKVNGPLVAGAIARNGNIAGASRERNQVCIWAGSERVETCRQGVAHPGVVAISEGGSIRAAVVGEDVEGAILSLDPPSRIAISNKEGIVTSAGFDREAKLFFTAAKLGPVRIWNAATGVVSGIEVRPGDKDVLAAALSEDGRLVASANAGGSLAFWSIPESKVTKIFRVSLTEISRLAFDPNAHRLLAVTGKTKARIFELDNDALNRRACKAEKDIRQNAAGRESLTTCSNYMDERQCSSDCERILAAPTAR